MTAAILTFAATWLALSIVLGLALGRLIRLADTDDLN